MARCSSCSSDVPPGKRFCGDCGVALDTPTSAPTETSLSDAAPPSPSRSASAPSFDSKEGERFLPGVMLAGRYRIVGLLGRGGMGEVYRAADLRLGQTVALKFLPEAFEKDPGRLQRFLGEVRIARQVTHPNVCRVYDVGEADGQHFLCMEYVDGEDLGSLLRRIGRLPEDKAVQLARQICAGLAAAHDQGILHRDLKPANVMIDGRGRARITDFGLAGLVEGFEGAEVRAGRPAYMAPEQLTGSGVNMKSDVYSLGLVLYELFTGKQAFEAGSVAGAIILTVIAAFLAGAVVLALRSLRLGRGDRRGATRLATFVDAAPVSAWLIGGHHVADDSEIMLIIVTLSGALLLGALTWVLYMALEPYVRRLWPESLVGWTRLLAGRLRDPLVGRDLLVGMVLGVALQLFSRGFRALGEAAMLASGVLSQYPVTLDFSAPYVGAGMFGMLVVAAYAVYGFRTSLGGRAVFQDRILQERSA